MKLQIIDYQQVTYLEAEQNYTRIYFDGGRNIVFPKTLKRFEEQLINQPNFVKINRGCIINKKFIEMNDEYEVKMNCGKELNISRRRKVCLIL